MIMLNVPKLSRVLERVTFYKRHPIEGGATAGGLNYCMAKKKQSSKVQILRNNTFRNDFYSRTNTPLWIGMVCVLRGGGRGAPESHCCPGAPCSLNTGMGNSVTSVNVHALAR